MASAPSSTISNAFIVSGIAIIRIISGIGNIDNIGTSGSFRIISTIGNIDITQQVVGQKMTWLQGHAVLMSHEGMQGLQTRF